MELKIIVQIWDDLKNSKEVVDRLIEENLKKKLDWYLKKYESKKDAEWILEFKVDKNNRDLFDAILQVNLDGDSFRYSREDYKNLDDLINHLFDHLKEKLSSK